MFESEKSTMRDLIQQAQVQIIDLAVAWEKANVNQWQEMAKGLFPDALLFSPETKFFERQNTRVTGMQIR